MDYQYFVWNMFIINNIHSDDFFLFLFTVTREQALVQKWYNKVVLAAVYPFIRERDILQSSRTHEGTRTPVKYDRCSLNGAVNISQKKKKIFFQTYFITYLKT